MHTMKRKESQATVGKCDKSKTRELDITAPVEFSLTKHNEQYFALCVNSIQQQKKRRGEKQGEAVCLKDRFYLVRNNSLAYVTTKNVQNI